MAQIHSHREFISGTTGWTVEDWYDLDREGKLPEGRFEIVDGVLTAMAPQGFEGVDPLTNLRDLVWQQLTEKRQKGKFHHEVDVLLRSDRVPRPDMIYLTAEQRKRQKELQRGRNLPPGRYHPIYVTPSLVVESLSLDNEQHDRITKRKWYADAGVSHYWLLTQYERSLVCLVLKGKKYITESAGVNDDTVISSVFGGVTIPLAQVWDDL